MKTKLKFNDFLKQNSPTILTVVGVIGVGLTAVMSARDTVKAMKRIEEEENIYYKKELPRKQKIKLAAPCYIPTVLTGVSTILCICGANKLNKNMQKSLTSAYVMLDQSYKEYKKSVKNVFGEEGHRHVVEEIADIKSEELTVVENPGTDIFFDYFSLQFFESSLESVRKVEKTANEMLHRQGYISLGTLYSLIGLEVADTDSLLGWSLNAGEVYDYDSIKFDIQKISDKDGSAHYVLDFVDTPTEDYLYI